MAGYSVPQYQWIYQNAPAVGGSLYVYQTATTTPVTIYSDGGLTTPITNPLVLDSNGEGKFYVASSVNLRLDAYTSTNVFIQSIDPVSVIPDLSNAGTSNLSALAGVTAGTVTASKVLIVDANSNLTGLATNAPNVSSTQIANMAAVQNSQTGGYVNKIRNAGFLVFQRGLSGTITAGSPAYAADGFIISCTGANVTWARATTGSTQITPNSIQINGAVSNTGLTVKQRIEGNDCYGMVSTNTTFQAWVYNATGGALTPKLTVKTANALDNWGATTTVINAVNLQTLSSTPGWYQVAYVFTGGASSNNGVEITIDFGSITSSLLAVNTTQWDLRPTAGATTGLPSNIVNIPSAEVLPYFAELSRCQRFLPAFGDIVGVIGHGAATSTSASGYIIPFKVPTRIAPTGLTVTTVGDFEIATYAAADVAATTGLTFNASGSSNLHAFVTATVAGTPLTSAVAYYLYTKTALAGNLIFSGAEL